MGKEEIMPDMGQPAKYVQPIHFEDFGGLQFERLVFAYHARTDKWRSLEWYGQSGSDLGRDIWGVRDDGTDKGESVCVQCVNRGNLRFAKIQADFSKVLKASNAVPQRFRVVTRSSVSAAMREKIKKYVTSNGVSHCDIWSGDEFEEFLRHGAESLLKRFTQGEAFPDAASDLLTLAQADGLLSDDDALALMAKLFDRPAFYTPIHQESNLGDFQQAITDTIQALGTGIWKARDSHVIARISSRQQLRDEALRKKVQAVEKATSYQTTFTYVLSNNTSSSKSITFAVVAPAKSQNTISFQVGTGAAIQDDRIYSLLGATLSFLPGRQEGITFHSAGPATSNRAGFFSWVQLVLDYRFRKQLQTGETQICTTSSGFPALDNTYPYGSGTREPTVYTISRTNDYASDTPSIPTDDSAVELKSLFSAQMFLMWDPKLPDGCQIGLTCTSIPVPLASVKWSATADAINTIVSQANGTNHLLFCGLHPDGTYQSVVGATAAGSYPEWKYLLVNSVSPCQNVTP